MRSKKGKISGKMVQVTFKVLEPFLKRFDEVAEACGYTRTEAIREAMRRFVEQESQKLMNRPENVAQTIRQVIENIVAPLMRATEVLTQKEIQERLEVPVKSKQ